MADDTSTLNGAPAPMDVKMEVYKSRVSAVQSKGQTYDGVMAFYQDWATDYDQDNATIGYQGPRWAATQLAEQGLAKDAHILDVAAGTGLCARILRDDYGFTNIDALEPSQEMLNISRPKNIYKNLYCIPIGDGYRTPFDDDTYDAAVMAGGLAEGHVKCDCFEELVRIVKPGGYIVNSMREENRRLVEEYTKLDATVQALEHSGAWKKIVEDITPSYYLDKEGLTWVFQVTKS